MSESTAETKPKAKGQRGKGIEEVVSYSMGHRIRIEVLTLLNERVYSVEELSEMIGEPTNKVAYHVNELADAGAIELAHTETVRNANRHYYRAVEQPYVSAEEALLMPVEQRQVMAGITLQCMMAESMASFWAGNMVKDPERVVLSWRWFNVDRESQDEIAQELKESWERIQEIEARSVARRAESKEEPSSFIVAQQLFPRSRTTMLTPAPLGNPE